MYLAEHEAYVIQNACTGRRKPEDSENRICGSDETLFIPYLQPLYNVAQDRIYGAEVLARKLGPCGKVHIPDEFIAAMEAERRISEVDYRMFEHACSILNLYETIRPDLRLSCNFSRLTLSDENFIRRIDETLQQSGVDSRKLIFQRIHSQRAVSLCNNPAGYHIRSPLTDPLAAWFLFLLQYSRSPVCDTSQSIFLSQSVCADHTRLWKSSSDRSLRNLFAANAAYRGCLPLPPYHPMQLQYQVI